MQTHRVIKAIAHEDVINEGARAALRIDIQASRGSFSGASVRLAGDVKSFVFWRSDNGRSILSFIKAMKPELDTDGVYDLIKEVRVDGMTPSHIESAKEIIVNVVLKQPIEVGSEFARKPNYYDLPPITAEDFKSYDF